MNHSNFNSLILALGTNIGDRYQNLLTAINKLSNFFNETSRSSIYESDPVDFLDQPCFYNMVIEYDIPSLSPLETLKILKSIEFEMGRIKSIEKGPRVIDIDIIFWGNQKIHGPMLTIPHPNYLKRSFVCLPLLELKSGPNLPQRATFPKQFESACKKIISF